MTPGGAGGVITGGAGVCGAGAVGAGAASWGREAAYVAMRAAIT